MKHAVALGLLVAFFTTAKGSSDLPLPQKEDVLPDNRALTLKFNLKPGEQYFFSSATKQNITQSFMGQQMATTQDILSEYIYDIQSVQNGITAINVTFSRIKMDTDVAGMQRITFDSENPEASSNELSAISNLVGKSFQMYINEEGNVEKVEGLADIIDAAGGQQAELLKQSFGDSSMILSMNQMTNIYPANQVEIGDSWVKAFTGPIAGMMQSEATSTFVLSKTEGNVATLTVAGQMNFSKLQNGGNPMLQGAEFKLKGTQEGTLQVDVESGLPIQTNLKQDIGGDIEIQGMQIPMSIVSDITITGKKL
ncbi:hypothetical protein SAMN05660226_01083 [Parapedobacter luteus]|uniref:Uncharacterized protein n=1 Tax=Parapedobacter luteus TaxID=623280 RepID=A0A1T5AV24_9SPHI|nr:DUF6263 family protein [Parapedobacter luteus]SKB38868.1 hypothetical protein SAMN05660226_01083 [Parapedobacter luteus]